MTLSEIYREGKRILSEADDSSPAFEAGQILFSVFGVKRSELVLTGSQTPSQKQENLFFRHIEMRLNGYPLQYILGEWDFYGIPFHVGEGVLIPRPETELLIDTCLDLLEEMREPVIYDLCSGSGCIAVAAALSRKDAAVYAMELSKTALSYLERNIERSGASNITVLRQDVLDSKAPKKADMILCNPPYIRTDCIGALQREVRFEPVMALDGGEDGLYFYRGVTRLYYDVLKCGGWLLFELGIGQAQEVWNMLSSQGYMDISVKCDLSGVERVICARKNCN